MKLNEFTIEKKDKIKHTAHFINTFSNNDYPTSITRHLNYKKSRKLHWRSSTCFLKLPCFSEIITKEIRRAVCKEGIYIQLAHPGSSLRQYQTKKNNTITTCTLANCPNRDPNICQKTYTIYRLICLKCHNFYIRSTIRLLHIRIKKLLNTQCKNNDDNFSIEIEVIVRNVGNLRIKEALSIGKLHPQINCGLELNTEYIIN